AVAQEPLAQVRVCGLTSVGLAYGFMLADQGLLVAPLEAERLFPEQASLGLGCLAVCCGLAQLVGPAAGKWSDSYSSVFGRRRPCMVMSLVGIVFLTGGLRVCSELRWRSSFLLVFLLQQVCWNVILTVQAGLVPDQVPVEQQGFAGGATAAFTLTGALGALLLVRLVGGLGLQTHYAIAVALAALCTAAVCATADEEPSLPACPPARAASVWSQVCASYEVDLSRHPDFAKLLLSKTMYCSSVMVKGFLFFFIQDTFRLSDNQRAQALVGQVAIAAETTAALSAGLAMLLLDRARPRAPLGAAAEAAPEATFGALSLPTAAAKEGCQVPPCAAGRLLARSAAVSCASWMGLLWFGPLLVGLGVLRSRQAGVEADTDGLCGARVKSPRVPSPTPRANRSSESLNLSLRGAA
ncbi:unnamed protein product, partial [Prorocentrum cordatum]